MSYSCYISFKSLNAEDVYPFLQRFKKLTLSSLEDIAKEEFPYCPFVRKHLMVKKDFDEITLDEIEEGRNWMTNSVFKHRYFYDKDNKLLGVYGVPTAVRSIFDGTVYFQNSCDQNYDRKDWEGIAPFEAIYDKYMNLSFDELVSAYEKDGNSFVNDYLNATIAELDYCRKALCYKEIWDNISYTLFDDDEVLYLSIFGYRDYTTAQKFLKYCHEAELDWEKKNIF